MTIARIACLGGSHIDRHGVLHGPLMLGTSNPGRVSDDFGGVARKLPRTWLAWAGVFPCSPAWAPTKPAGIWQRTWQAWASILQWSVFRQ